MRLGALGLAGGVGAAALAACGEGEVEVRTVEVEKIVTVTEIKEVEVEKVVEKEVVREVPVERVVTQEVQIEKIVEVEKVVEVPQETQVEGVFEIGPVKAVRFGNYRDLTPYNPQYGGKITHAAPGAINNLDPLHFPDAWSLMGGGQPLFDALIAHATQAAFVHVHTWQRHDIVIWDNRCTMHRASPHEGDHARRLLRILIEGTVPV